MQRQFSEGDQLVFADLSGDRNPLHVDRIAARRLLFGGPVVHGVNLILWALNEAARGLNAPHRLVSLSAAFAKPVLVGDKVSLKLERTDADVTAVISASSGPAATIRYTWQPIDADAPNVNLPNAEGICRDLTFDQAAASVGRLFPQLDRALLHRIAPDAGKRLPQAQIATLLVTTRLVGMECPGLHSLFNSLKLDFDDASLESGPLVYKVSNALERYAFLTIDLSAPGVSGKAQTSYRPPPRRQASLSEVRNHVDANEFASQRALVIGGSRGLGEVTAKIVCAGGGQTRITWRSGGEDADAVAAELGERGSAVRFDAAQPVVEALAEVKKGFEPTHVYYFASPRILLDGSRVFDQTRFSDYTSIYVSGFCELVRALSGAGDSETPVFFFPSTIFIDEPVPNALEYIAAKAAGEGACAALAAELGAKFVMQRLPQLATDQTVGLLGVAGDDPVETMVDVVRRMNHQDSAAVPGQVPVGKE